MSEETFRDALREARSNGNYEALLQLVPYAALMNFELARDGDELVTTMRFEPHLIGNKHLPALHGGTTGSLLETSAIFMLMLDQDLAVLPKTITITVDYLRSARDRDTHAVSEVTRIGRRVATVQTTAWQDDRSKPVARGNAHFLVTG